MTLLWWFILGFAIIGACAVVCFFFLILGAYCMRSDLDRFNGKEQKLAKIVPGPWVKR